MNDYHRVNIKALTANRLWWGRKYPTDQYKKYREDLLLLLPNDITVPPPPAKLGVIYEFGLSNTSADYDNCIKGFQDALQLKYGFDDNRIFSATIRKKLVEKGDEHIYFRIYDLSYEARKQEFIDDLTNLDNSF